MESIATVAEKLITRIQCGRRVLRHYVLRSVLVWFVIAAQVDAAERPNVLFIVSDDNEPELACYSDPYARTPNLDRVARRAGKTKRSLRTSMHMMKVAVLDVLMTINELGIRRVSDPDTHQLYETDDDVHPLRISTSMVIGSSFGCPAVAQLPRSSSSDCRRRERNGPTFGNIGL